MQDLYVYLAERLGQADEIYLKESWMPVKLRRIDETTLAVQLSKTDIVTSTPYFVAIDNGGWWTHTTKEKINEFLPSGWYLSQSNYFWYLSRGWGQPEYPYAHGITISDASVAGERELRPRNIRLRGKYMPLFTIEEYVERVYTTLAYWEIKHVWYEDIEYRHHPSWEGLWKEFRKQVLPVLEKVQGALDDMQTAPNNDELLAATLHANSIMHVHGEIVRDYGKGRGLPYRVVEAISHGAHEYFGWDMLAKFDKRTELMRVPEYMTRAQHYAQRR